MGPSRVLEPGNPPIMIRVGARFIPDSPASILPDLRISRGGECLSWCRPLYAHSSSPIGRLRGTKSIDSTASPVQSLSSGIMSSRFHVLLKKLEVPVDEDAEYTNTRYCNRDLIPIPPGRCKASASQDAEF
jgi:hypothetical protein